MSAKNTRKQTAAKMSATDANLCDNDIFECTDRLLSIWPCPMDPSGGSDVDEETFGKNKEVGKKKCLA